MSSISSIPPFVPAKAPEPTSPKTPEVNAEASADKPKPPEPSAPQPTVLAPLPPGQGTRIDQFV
jgi:hypothetical protein